MKIFPSQAVDIIANTSALVGFIVNASARLKRVPSRPLCKVQVDATIIQESKAKLDTMITHIGLEKPAMP